MVNAITFDHVSFAYEPTTWAIQDMSFSIKPGSYTVILGHNGSGKSTLAKLIVGLMTPQKGSIEVQGLPLSAKTIQEIRQKVGIVFQNPDNQFIGATVKDDIAFGLENRCVPSSQMEGIISEFAEKVGMTAFLDQEPTHLSGGQKQRVAIAGVLAMTPQIVILDEATSMLDPRGKEEITLLTRQMRQLYPQLTIISITHDIEEAVLADHLIILNQGKIELQGTPKEIFKLPTKELQKIRLDIPFTYQIQRQLQTLYDSVPATTRIDELADSIWKFYSTK